MQIGGGWFCFFLLISFQIAFYAAQWEEYPCYFFEKWTVPVQRANIVLHSQLSRYHTGVLELGYLNVTEAQIILMVIHLITAFNGMNTLDFRKPLLPGTPVICSPLCLIFRRWMVERCCTGSWGCSLTTKNVSYFVPVGRSLRNSCRQVSGPSFPLKCFLFIDLSSPSLVKITQHIVKERLDIVKVYSHIVPVVSATALGTLWAYFSPTDIVHNQAVTYSVGLGFLMANLVVSILFSTYNFYHPTGCWPFFNV